VKTLGGEVTVLVMLDGLVVAGGGVTAAGVVLAAAEAEVVDVDAAAVVGTAIDRDTP